jgi:hypothetical protein
LPIGQTLPTVQWAHWLRYPCPPPAHPPAYCLWCCPGSWY